MAIVIPNIPKPAAEPEPDPNAEITGIAPVYIIKAKGGSIDYNTGSTTKNIEFNTSIYEMSVTGHNSEPTIHSNGRWINLKSGYTYKLTCRLNRNDSQTASMGFVWLKGGSYGYGSGEFGVGGNISGYDNGAARGSLHGNNMEAVGIITMTSNDWVRVCMSTNNNSMSIYAGNANYGDSYAMIEVIGKA